MVLYGHMSQDMKEILFIHCAAPGTGGDAVLRVELGKIVAQKTVETSKDEPLVSGSDMSDFG